MQIFELAGVVRRFDGAAALDGVDLRIGEGERVALIGPSGCGKSTLLKVMLGLVQPHAGSVRYRGAPLLSRDLDAFRRQLGYVVQGGGLFPHLSAADNATLLPRWLGWDRARQARRLEELGALVRLPRAALERYPAQLSGGQAQRVSLMRALMLDPEVLLLDEPLGALDPITRFELQRDLREVFTRLAKTVVLVTHDLGEAAYLAGRLVLMRAGQVVQQGPLRALLEAPAEPFVERFIGAQRAPAGIAETHA